MAKSAKLKSTVEPRGRPRKRAEQQRSLETRGAILDAAIAEFAERGFEGASIRAIADRLGLQHPLITYHYRSKDVLWRAAAEHAFAQIRAGWDTSAPENSDLPPLARLREEYAILFHYMMVSLTATLSGFGPEMQVTSGLSAENAKVIEAYWRLVDETVFGKHVCGKPARVNQASKR